VKAVEGRKSSVESKPPERGIVPAVFIFYRHPPDDNAFIARVLKSAA
jgi:hypothetical protein